MSCDISQGQIGYPISWWESSISHLFSTSVVAQPHNSNPPCQISDPAAIEMWNSNEKTLWIAKGTRATSWKVNRMSAKRKSSSLAWAHKYSPESVYMIKGCVTTS